MTMAGGRGTLTPASLVLPGAGGSSLACTQWPGTSRRTLGKDTRELQAPCAEKVLGPILCLLFWAPDGQAEGEAAPSPSLARLPCSPSPQPPELFPASHSLPLLGRVSPSARRAPRSLSSGGLFLSLHESLRICQVPLKFPPGYFPSLHD